MKFITSWDKLGKDFGAFNDSFNSAFDGIMKPIQSFDFMRTDIKEDEKAFVMEIDLPGYEKSNITVNFEDEYIEVSAKKVEKTDDEKKGYIRMERSCECNRSYYVGDIDEKNIKAKYENGVLTLNLPKKADEAPKSHSITID